MHLANPSTDVEIGSHLTSQSFLSRVVTRFRLWRSPFKREDHQQVVPPQMTEHRVSGTIEAIELDIGSYLGTPTAFASPPFSVRLSLPPGVLLDMHSVFNHGDDFGGVTDAHSGELESSMFSNALRLEGLPGRTSMDADGVLPARPFPSHHPPQIQFEVCFLRLWALVTYQFGLGYAFD